MKKDEKESDIRHLVSLVWRQYSQYHASFSPCINGCETYGRDGGPCIDCIMKRLNKLIGAKKANAVKAAVISYTTAMIGAMSVLDD